MSERSHHSPQIEPAPLRSRQTRPLRISKPATHAENEANTEAMKPRRAKSLSEMRSATHTHAEGTQTVARTCWSESASDGRSPQDQQWVYLLFGEWKTITGRKDFRPLPLEGRKIALKNLLGTDGIQC
jgi:hypothetical protein